jgi:hypothetical protein
MNFDILTAAWAIGGTIAFIYGISKVVGNDKKDIYPTKYKKSKK